MTAEDGPTRLPDTLHGRLFLLAHHRRRRRFDGARRPRYGVALRAAMLSDLYLSGRLTDHGGTPTANAANDIDDDLLRELYDEIRSGEYRDWGDAVLRGSHAVTPAAVESQLAHTWRRSERHRVLCVLPRTRVRIANPGLVDTLANDIADTIDAAIDGRPTDDRHLAIGLIGALGQLPTVVSFTVAERRYDDLHSLVSNGIPPVLGLLDVVKRFRTSAKINYDNYFHQNAG